MTTPAKKATKKRPAAKKAAAKKTTTTTPATAASPREASYGIAVGRVVEHRFHDVLTDTDVVETGIVVRITDDGAYVAPLSGAAVVPLDRLRVV